MSMQTDVQIRLMDVENMDFLAHLIKHLMDEYVIKACKVISFTKKTWFDSSFEIYNRYFV